MFEEEEEEEVKRSTQVSETTVESCDERVVGITGIVPCALIIVYEE